MVTFKQFLAEYATKENARFFGITKLKAGNNGKLLDNTNRKHKNTFAKKYIHKNPLVDNICQGQANNVQVSGDSLLSILAQYEVQFEPGVKTLGNSCVEVEMFHDNNGMQKGVLRNKKQNGL